LPQESGNACHPEVIQLGQHSGHNDVRDFWRHADIPVASWFLKAPGGWRKGNTFVAMVEIINYQNKGLPPTCKISINWSPYFGAIPNWAPQSPKKPPKLCFQSLLFKKYVFWKS